MNKGQYGKGSKEYKYAVILPGIAQCCLICPEEPEHRTPERDQREMRAVERMLESCTDERRRFIEVYYWRGNRIETAAYLSHIGEATARRWNGEIVRSVARELKLLRKNDTVRPSK